MNEQKILNDKERMTEKWNKKDRVEKGKEWNEIKNKKIKNKSEKKEQ